MQRRSSMATPESSNDLGSHKFRSLMARVGKTRKGTGPRTRLGKERSKHNALRHGIFSKAAILTSESQPEFDSLLNGLCKDFRPIGRLEETLVEILAVTLWRQRRTLIAEAAEIQAGIESIEHPEDPHAPIRAILACRRHHDDGLIRSIANAEALSTCIDLLRKLKARVSANVLDPQKDKLVLTGIYADSPDGNRLYDFFDNCVTGLTAARCDGKEATVQEASKTSS